MKMLFDFQTKKKRYILISDNKIYRVSLMKLSLVPFSQQQDLLRRVGGYTGMLQ